MAITHFHWIGFVDSLNEVAWHIFRQTADVIVEIGYPAVDFVQFEENARRTLVVAVVVLLCAFLEILDVDVTHFTGWRWLIVFAIEYVLTASRCQARCFVN